MTRPSVLGDVSGLSPEAIEALPAVNYITDAEGRITLQRACRLRGAVARARQEQAVWTLQALPNQRHAHLTGSEPYGHDA
jgi:hypothetical protein